MIKKPCCVVLLFVVMLIILIGAGTGLEGGKGIGGMEDGIADELSESICKT
jgi:hypothetical protein